MQYNTNLENETRKIFHDIHCEQISNPVIFERLTELLSTEYLGVGSNFFLEKICLDAGCGSNANATYGMLQSGAKKVYAFDLNKTILEEVPEKLDKFAGQYELTIGNLLNLQYEDNFFDFVHCSGVVHHSNDVFQSLTELTRVLKNGGLLYTVINGQGGIIREITNLLRDKYRTDDHFKRLIDDLNSNDFKDFFEWISIEMKSQGDPFFNKISLSFIETLFDQDLILTIKDRITAPVYEEHSEEELVDWFKNNGFAQIERLVRYPKYNGLRRFLSPLYYRYEHKFSRLLYGTGSIQLKVTKAT